MLFVTSIFILVLIPESRATVTDKDLEEQLGIDVKGLKNVTWRDWINNFPIPPAGNVTCDNKKSGTHYACCNNDTRKCGDNKNMICVKQKRCECKRGYFPDFTKNGCIRRTTKELNEKCAPMKDNCYAAYSICKNGLCQCMDGFQQIRNNCMPLTYHCPYGKPLITAVGKRTVVQPCTLKGNEQPPCPKGYFCLVMNLWASPKFVSVSGVDAGYCCPSMPNVTSAEPFDEHCFYGEALPGQSCPSTADNPRFLKCAISRKPLCCPTPCPWHTENAVVVDGKCSNT